MNTTKQNEITTQAPPPASANERSEFERTPLNKPSRLIRLALQDLGLCAVDPVYTIDFDAWHIPYLHDDGKGEQRNVCHVCFAGAVMAQSLGLDPERTIRLAIDIQDKDLVAKFLALNQFRTGHIARAFRDLGLSHVLEHFRPLGIPTHLEIPEVWLPFPSNGLAPFVEAMERVAHILATAGY